MSDIVQNNETGFVLDPHDEKAWAESIIKILQNPDLADKMGEKGKNVLDTKYTMDSMYEKLEKMYNEVLEIDSY
jgi:glycosyltransferase involved in cell wall biosynthesis